MGKPARSRRRLETPWCRRDTAPTWLDALPNDRATVFTVGFGAQYVFEPAPRQPKKGRVVGIAKRSRAEGQV